MAGPKSTILLVVVNAAAVSIDTGESGGGFSTSVMIISGMLWLVYICLAMVDQLLSAMFPGQDEDEQQEAYQRRAEGVENAGRQLAALHKKKGGGD
mgnify:CR=1 FL=1